MKIYEIFKQHTEAISFQLMVIITHYSVYVSKVHFVKLH